MRRLIVLSALALGACGGSSENSGSPPTPPDLAANFNQPIDARGANPAWGLKIRGLQFTLDRPGQPDVTATAPGAAIQPHSASWAASLPNGQTMKVSLFATACVDPVSGSTYPFAAEVQLPGSAPLNGCAGQPARRP